MRPSAAYVVMIVATMTSSACSSGPEILEDDGTVALVATAVALS